MPCSEWRMAPPWRTTTCHRWVGRAGPAAHTCYPTQAHGSSICQTPSQTPCLWSPSAVLPRVKYLPGVSLFFHPELGMRSK